MCMGPLFYPGMLHPHPPLDPDVPNPAQALGLMRPRVILRTAVGCGAMHQGHAGFGAPLNGIAFAESATVSELSRLGARQADP